MRRFETLDSQGTKLRSGHQRALGESDRERRTLHDKQNVLEKDLDIANLENLKLKGLNFELDMSIGDYQLLVEQT